MNTHGHAGNLGNVLPQPIDLVFTRLPASCTNCPYNFAYNRHSVRYFAPPSQAFMIAYTGAHILLRSGFDIYSIGLSFFFGLTFALTVLVFLYSEYFRETPSTAPDLAFRFFVSLALSFFSIFGITFWTTIFYPVAILHAVASVSFALNFVPFCSAQK